jgi:hypothetical protein
MHTIEVERSIPLQRSKRPRVRRRCSVSRIVCLKRAPLNRNGATITYATRYASRENTRCASRLSYLTRPYRIQGHILRHETDAAPVDASAFLNMTTSAFVPKKNGCRATEHMNSSKLVFTK